jgi:hypothetical protein
MDEDQILASVAVSFLIFIGCGCVARLAYAMYHPPEEDLMYYDTV